MRILVTGGAGFIGGRVALALAERGHDVVVLDSLLRPAPGVPEKLEEKGIRVAVLDVRSSLLGDLLASVRPDAVIHAAALIRVDESWSRPALYNSVNAYGSLNVARLSAKRGVSKLVYLSSAAVYGEPRRLPVSEDHPTRPLSPYGASKLAGEAYVLAARGWGLEASVLRLFNVYGEGQKPEYAGVITRFVEQALSGSPLTVFGDGKQTRDFVYVGDVAEAVRAALEAGSCLCNVGSGVETSILELAETVMKAVGRRPGLVFEPGRPGDVRRSVADISLAKKLLGWEPRTPLREGLGAVAAWLKKRFSVYSRGETNIY